jgi:pimeloyl-ACP methyl ester carboxylesterase
MRDVWTVALVALMAVELTACGQSAVPRDFGALLDRSSPPVATDRLIEPQTRVKVDGKRRLNLLCMGSGTPTVIFESGTGGGTYDWRLVQGAIAQKTTACSYDRAGYGFSDPATRRSDARNAVDDLHRLIVHAGLRRPVVLVGHSNGGIYAVLYAQTFPKDVAGMVLVDPGFTGQQEFDLYGLSPAKASELKQGNTAWIQFARQCAALAKAGILAQSQSSSSPCLDNPPNPDPRLHRVLNEIQSKPPYTDALLSEFQSTFQMTGATTINDREVPLQPGELGHLPLIVLTASEHKASPADFTPMDQAKYYTYWKQGHDRVAKLSTQGRNIVIARSGHFIQKDQPDEVIRYVTDVLELAAKDSVASGAPGDATRPGR